MPAPTCAAISCRCKSLAVRQIRPRGVHTAAVLEDRIRALRESNKYYIHTGRHVSGLPCLIDDGVAEAPFAVYQTDHEGETRLFVTELFHDQLEAVGPRLKFRDKAILLDTFAIPSLARDTAVYRRGPRRLFYARMSRGRRL